MDCKTCDGKGWAMVVFPERVGRVLTIPTDDNSAKKTCPDCKGTGKAQ